MHEVALTFDDGPSPVFTKEILALLKQYQAKATFFVLGKKVEEQYPQIIRAMVRDGHEMGNHTFDHPRLTQTAKRVCERELERTRLDLDLLGCSNQPQLMLVPLTVPMISSSPHTSRTPAGNLSCGASGVLPGKLDHSK